MLNGVGCYNQLQLKCMSCLPSILQMLTANSAQLSAASQEVSIEAIRLANSKTLFTVHSGTAASYSKHSLGLYSCRYLYSWCLYVTVEKINIYSFQMMTLLSRHIETTCEAVDNQKAKESQRRRDGLVSVEAKGEFKNLLRIQL